ITDNRGIRGTAEFFRLGIGILNIAEAVYKFFAISILSAEDATICDSFIENVRGQMSSRGNNLYKSPVGLRNEFLNISLFLRGHFPCRVKHILEFPAPKNQRLQADLTKKFLVVQGRNYHTNTASKGSRAAHNPGGSTSSVIGSRSPYGIYVVDNRLLSRKATQRMIKNIRCCYLASWGICRDYNGFDIGIAGCLLESFLQIIYHGVA